MRRQLIFENTALCAGFSTQATMPCLQPADAYSLPLKYS